MLYRTSGGVEGGEGGGRGEGGGGRGGEGEGGRGWGAECDGTTHVCVNCTRTSTEHPEHIRHSSHVLSLMHLFLQGCAGSFCVLE